jgi:hypothetical protein
MGGTCRFGDEFMASDSGIGTAITRLMETISRLLVQHAQLLRSELETESRLLTDRVRSSISAIARAAPFLIAGAVLVSFAAGQLLGLALEPWLGRTAVPLSMATLGVWEVAIAARWLQRRLSGMERPDEPRRGSTSVLPAVAKSSDGSGLATAERRGTILHWRRVPDGAPGTREETRYGIVG